MHILQSYRVATGTLRLRSDGLRLRGDIFPVATRLTDFHGCLVSAFPALPRPPHHA